MYVLRSLRADRASQCVSELWWKFPTSADSSRGNAGETSRVVCTSCCQRGRGRTQCILGALSRDPSSRALAGRKRHRNPQLIVANLERRKTDRTRPSANLHAVYIPGPPPEPFVDYYSGRKNLLAIRLFRDTRSVDILRLNDRAAIASTLRIQESP